MWVREMLVSIVTVLSRLPSLAATMEVKFSAPAESKAMVKPSVLIHPLLTSVFDVMWPQAVYFDPVCAFCFPQALFPLLHPLVLLDRSALNVFSWLWSFYFFLFYCCIL